MRFLSLKRFGSLALLVIALGLFVFITTHARANTPSTGEASSPAAAPDWSVAKLGSSSPVLVVTPPPPKTEPCLSCHILGQNKGLWTPLGRWVLFGSLGVVFAFGVYRSASTWVTRSPWKPLTHRAGEWFEERYKIADPLQKILKKPVPKYALTWWYCLGGITAFLFVVQGITGILLAFYYKPTPEAAFASIQYIENQVYFGSAIRAIHHWCANGMIVMCVAHMARVFIMGAYKRPREMNWVSGVLLLMLTLVFGFTGYLLPWDQRAFWATTVGSEIAGAIPAIGNLALVFLRVGWNVTGETLSRFYGLHVIVVPLATVAFMLAHFMMIRRQGIAKPL
jgi:hypothetical protein